MLEFVIRSFGAKETKRIWRGQYVKSLDHRIQRPVLRKLELIHAAADLEYQRIPPGNRLEKLKGGRMGQHSVRVNDQWRICIV